MKLIAFYQIKKFGLNINLLETLFMLITTLLLANIETGKEVTLKINTNTIKITQTPMAGDINLNGREKEPKEVIMKILIKLTKNFVKDIRNLGDIQE